MTLQNARHAKDIRPPWLMQDFPQALPGGGVLSKCTRPSFLQWGAKETATLFGEQVHGRLTWRSESVSLTFAGIITRPLYACTEVVDTATHELCMNVASMSRFLQQPAGRPIYKCAKCSQREPAQRAEGAKQEPGSASSSLRILWAYPLVEGMDGKPMALRVSFSGAPRRACTAVHVGMIGRAGHGQHQPHEGDSGCPREHPPRHYWHSAAESAEIWLASKPYQAQLPLLE